MANHVIMPTHCSRVVERLKKKKLSLVGSSLMASLSRILKKDDIIWS